MARVDKHSVYLLLRFRLSTCLPVSRFIYSTMPRPETTVSEEEAGSGEEDELAGSDENGEYEIEKIIKHKVEGVSRVSVLRTNQRHVLTKLYHRARSNTGLNGGILTTRTIAGFMKVMLSEYYLALVEEVHY